MIVKMKWNVEETGRGLICICLKDGGNHKNVYQADIGMRFEPGPHK
jgi:hypothetical protein